MKNIKTRLDFINENDHSIDDPYGEEDWNYGMLNFRYIDDSDDLFEWMKDIGIVRDDVRALQFFYNTAKRMKRNNDINGMNRYLNEMMFFSVKFKDKYGFSDDEFSSFVGIIAMRCSSMGFTDYYKIK